MQSLLPSRLAKSVNLVTLSVTKLFRTLLLASGLLIVFSMQANPLESNHIDFFEGCTYTATMLSDESTTVAIPCDFPVKSDSGNPEKDQENYMQAFMDWNQNNMDAINTFLMPQGMTGVKSIQVEIPQNEFDNFSDEKKTAILNASSVYSIIQ